MNTKQLFEMQRELDRNIEQSKGLSGQSLLERKFLAFYVELGELANETRCFKFWSDKGPSARQTILEEYVDGLHFLLSVGIELSYESVDVNADHQVQEVDQTAAFLSVYRCLEELRQNRALSSYEKLFHAYLMLGVALGFGEADIEGAYHEKNQVNFQRQREGY
ncbi:dUTP diphosphatase [Salisediminibacterium beveridgei]|uniref:Dimeric dUTPase n=1 Tax=Salisediminibacterium beveridgei TaxID=632773 RepID=A0A1D7QTJ1_9BACI|nr:dUTP diphosphatase [Salisediminibacterium beveridgei]AOM82288.1 Dimeric dUTPase [Salisediminibacterium beveridgei]